MADTAERAVTAYFDSAAQAEQAARDLMDWDKADGELTLGAIGVLTKDAQGQLQTRNLSARNTGKGAKIGLGLGALAAVLSGGLTLLPTALGGAVGGGLVGALSKKGLGLSDDDLQHLSAQLTAGHAALLVLCDDPEVEPAAARLAAAGGTVRRPADAVSAEALQEAAHAASAAAAAPAGPASPDPLAEPASPAPAAAGAPAAAPPPVPDAAPPAEPAPDGAWRPAHSGHAAAAGVLGLPRLIEKGRRRLAGAAAGRDLLGAYRFGADDPLDAPLLRFLDFDDEAVLIVLRREPDDGAAAAELVRRSGKTPDECAAWSARARRRHGALLATLDAAEGRRPPGAGTTLLTLLHQRVGVAATAAGYRRAAVAVALAGTALVGIALALAGVALRRRAGPRPPAGPHPPAALRDEIALARRWLSAGKRGG